MYEFIPGYMEENHAYYEKIPLETQISVILAVTDMPCDGYDANDIRTLRICKNHTEIAIYQDFIRDNFNRRSNFQRELYYEEMEGRLDSKYLAIAIENSDEPDIKKARFVRNMSEAKVFSKTLAGEKKYSKVAIFPIDKLKWNWSYDFEVFPEMTIFEDATLIKLLKH